MHLDEKEIKNIYNKSKYMIDNIVLPKFSFFFQGNDYTAHRNKCRKQIKALKRCQEKRGDSKEKCKRRRKRVEQCEVRQV